MLTIAHIRIDKIQKQYHISKLKIAQITILTRKNLLNPSKLNALTKRNVALTSRGSLSNKQAVAQVMQQS